MKKGNLKLSAILLLICSVLLWFLSISYNSKIQYEEYNIVLKYLAAFMFFVSLLSIGMSIVNLVLACSKKDNQNYKLFGFIGLLTLGISFLISISYVFTLDFTEDVFSVTFVFILLIFAIITILLETNCLIDKEKEEDSKESEQIAKLNDLLEKGFISQEEYDNKKKDILNNL